MLYHQQHNVMAGLWHSSVSTDSIKKPWEGEGDAAVLQEHKIQWKVVIHIVKISTKSLLSTIDCLLILCKCCKAFSVMGRK